MANARTCTICGLAENGCAQIPGHHFTPAARTITDEQAMTRLHAALTGVEWDASMWDASMWDVVSDVIIATGRVIAEPSDEMPTDVSIEVARVAEAYKAAAVRLEAAGNWKASAREYARADGLQIAMRIIRRHAATFGTIAGSERPGDPAIGTQWENRKAVPS